MAPPVVWAQRADVVLVTLQVADFTDIAVTFEEEKLSIKGKADDKELEVSVDLSKKVKPDASTWANTGREVQVKLQKADEGDDAWWDTLPKKKMNNVKIDWSKWKDEDELAGKNEDMGDFGMGGMPGGMGGMGGPGGMGGMGGMGGGMGGMPGMGGMGGMGGMPGMGDMGGMGGMDMEALMKQMGGAEGMGGMPGMEGEGNDSDDEPPPMEPAVAKEE